MKKPKIMKRIAFLILLCLLSMNHAVAQRNPKRLGTTTTTTVSSGSTNSSSSTNSSGSSSSLSSLNYSGSISGSATSSGSTNSTTTVVSGSLSNVMSSSYSSNANGYFIGQNSRVAQLIWIKDKKKVIFTYAPQVYKGGKYKGETVTEVWRGADVYNTQVSSKTEHTQITINVTVGGLTMPKTTEGPAFTTFSVPWTTTVASSAETVVFEPSFEDVVVRNGSF